MNASETSNETGAIINNKKRVKLSITAGRLHGMSKLIDETTHQACLYWYIYRTRATFGYAKESTKDNKIKHQFLY